MFTLITFVFGIFVGWNMEQPQFAKKIQQTVLDKFKNDEK